MLKPRLWARGSWWQGRRWQLKGKSAFETRLFIHLRQARRSIYTMCIKIRSGITDMNRNGTLIAESEWFTISPIDLNYAISTTQSGGSFKPIDYIRAYSGTIPCRTGSHRAVFSTWSVLPFPWLSRVTVTSRKITGRASGISSIIPDCKPIKTLIHQLLLLTACALIYTLNWRFKM